MEQLLKKEIISDLPLLVPSIYTQTRFCILEINWMLKEKQHTRWTMTFHIDIKRSFAFPAKSIHLLGWSGPRLDRAGRHTLERVPVPLHLTALWLNPNFKSFGRWIPTSQAGITRGGTLNTWDRGRVPPGHRCRNSNENTTVIYLAVRDFQSRFRRGKWFLSCLDWW